MRIISGKYRGLRLVAPQGSDTRPTLDRVKEAVFSMLMPYIQDTSVLDLFSGSGGLGLEALSRGADSVCFVDNNNAAIDAIKSNISKLKDPYLCNVYMEDSFRFLKSCNQKFDIIFVDPPYHENLYEEVLSSIIENDVLNEDAIVVVEWDSSYPKPIFNSKFNVKQSKKYGRVGVTLLQKG